MIIFNKQGGRILNVTVDDNSYRHRQVMGDHNLTLYFSLSEHVEIPVGSYCDFEGQRYFLKRPEALKMIHSRNFEYTVTLETYQADSKIWKFRNPVDGRLKFPLTATPREHLQMFVDNMNRRDTGWSVGDCIEGEAKLISYDHAYCWDALCQMADTFETEFEIEQKRVSLKRVEYNKTNPLPLSYGKGKGFKSGLGRSNYTENPPVEILYVQGGSQNIDPSKYKSSELHLPVNGTLGYDGNTFEGEVDYDEKQARRYVADDMGLSVRRLDKTLSSLAEDSLDCSSIYPKRVGRVTEVIVADKDNNFYDIIDTTIPDNLNFEDCLIEGETMTIIFQDGMLAGKEFEVKYYHKTVTINGKTRKAKRFEIVPQEIDGQTMPNETFAPVNGNSYAVFHCALPESYINAHKTSSDPKTGAEWDMMREAVRYLYDNEEQSFTFSGTLDGVWAKKDWNNIGGRIRLGGYVLFSDDNFQKEGVRIRIIGIKDYINNPHSPEIELSNNTVSAGFSTTIQNLTSQEVLTEEYHKEALQFTKRRWRDAKETMTMLSEAMLDNFSQSINPITVQTMQMLVGDESLQFQFVNNTDNPQRVSHNITYDTANKQLHCPAGLIQHLTLGIKSLSSAHASNEYLFWQVSEYLSGRLEDTEAKYYLYAKVQIYDKSSGAKNGSGEFILSESAKKMQAEDGFYYLLLGVLNSEYDGDRSFATLYGFTEILPSRVTTDRVVSGDGQSYFDMVANALKLGEKLAFNVDGDNELLLRGTLVQSQSGDKSTIGCYRGVYNPSYTYFNGDEVTYDIEGCTSLYRYINATPSSGHAPTETLYWQVQAKGSKGEDGKDGMDGISPNTAYKSTVFIRQNGTPATPSGGSYSNPVPAGWSDGIPAGELKLWASTRIFSSDGKAPQQAAWSSPRQMTDTADFDVEFSSEPNPSAPVGHPNTNAQWSNESDETTMWMATSRKTNGVWEDWQMQKIKGERGEDGTSIKVKGTCYGIFDTRADYLAAVTVRGQYYLIHHDEVLNADCVKVFTSLRNLVGVGYRTTYNIAEEGEAWVLNSDGHLYLANQEIGWQDIGQFKGDKGATGANGKNAYVHIKFANSLTVNDWTANNGETPGAYIGIYADNNVADQLVWGLYQWSKWQGQDGYGYEFIYKRTAEETAPATPTDISQAEDFVPSGWFDNPPSVTESEPCCWVCYRMKTDGKWGAFVGSAEDPTKAALWARYGKTGNTGAKGDYYEHRYCRSGSSVTAPDISKTSRTPSGWTTTLPSVPVGWYLWMTTAKISGRANALIGSWSTPVRVTGLNGSNGKDGADGLSPALNYRGVYDPSARYYGNRYRVDAVKGSDGKYYVARTDASPDYANNETFNVAPPDTSKWNPFGANFESVATQLLLAENANIAGWIFRNGRLESEAVNKEGQPMMYLNGTRGEARINGIIQLSTAYSGNISDANLFWLPRQTSVKNMSMGYEKEDLGKVVRLFNSGNIGDAHYNIHCTTFKHSGNFTDATQGYYVRVMPKEVVELTCFKYVTSQYDYVGSWQITNRFTLEENRHTDALKGRYPRMLAMGRIKGATVIKNSNVVIVDGKYYDGRNLSALMTATRQSKGFFNVRFASGLFPSGYKVFCTGYGANFKGAATNASDTGFDLYVSDDASLNNGDMEFMIMDYYWWYDYGAL